MYFTLYFREPTPYTKFRNV
uniref:Uncharacterized protein n=1 Tax=Anguilla anguilla TaxID=7936 RepID=A0A0E9USR1_ANGAN